MLRGAVFLELAFVTVCFGTTGPTPPTQDQFPLVLMSVFLMLMSTHATFTHTHNEDYFFLKP